ncbi:MULTISPECIES: acyltransferase family protein [unclassified Pseudarthrobacter]|uniref:acyltransferase family protein n=1 Tax=unclassified Pseudarthrobacter TaxID=2647000 RepID=UPI003629AC34
MLTPAMLTRHILGGPMPATGRRLASLTGLRFFAALAVVMYHLHLYVPPLADSLSVFGYGFTGVSFFFVLSGFVLAWSQRQHGSARSFYWHRIARIWPLHLLTTGLAVFTAPLPASPEFTWWAAPFVVSLTQSWIPASPFLGAFNGVSWSLSCEIFFYLAFPLLCQRLITPSLAARAMIVVPAAMLALPIGLAPLSSMAAADFLLGTMPLYRLGEFVLGMSVANLLKEGWRPRFSVLQAASLVGALNLALIIATAIWRVPIPVTFANLIMLPAFLALIAACTRADLSGRSSVLSSSVLIKLGEWSYALYLVHELLIRTASPYATSTDQAAWLAAVVVLVSISLSGLLHEFVEKPAERWLRGLTSAQPRRQVQHP